MQQTINLVFFVNQHKLSDKNTFTMCKNDRTNRRSIIFCRSTHVDRQTIDQVIITDSPDSITDYFDYDYMILKTSKFRRLIAKDH